MVKVLLEQSGYALDNLGDLAMLKVTVERIKRAWPDTEVRVPTTNPRRLANIVPSAIPLRVGFPMAPVPLVGRAASALQSSFRPGRALYSSTGPRRLISGDMGRAFEDADCVISSGGGFLCDTFLKHGVRVLELFKEAQRRGLPTAMFGQGIGPIANPSLSELTSHVLPKLDGLGLRVPHADSIARPSTWGMFGDDALQFPVAAKVAACGTGIRLGVNFRISSYNGAKVDELKVVGSELKRWARQVDAALQPVPIDLSSGGDAVAIETVLSPGGQGQSIYPAPDTVESLAAAAGSCDVVVTMSYHAAVFALGAGVPTICLTRSSYYDGKFKGLQDLYGESMCKVFTPEGLIEASVEAVLGEAVAVDSDSRSACQERSREMVDASEAFYDEVLESMALRLG